MKQYDTSKFKSALRRAKNEGIGIVEANGRESPRTSKTLP